MAVAKEGGRAECRPQLEEAALLGSAIYTGRAQGSGKPHANRGAQGPGLSLSLSLALSFSLSLRVFWVGMPSRLKDVFSFIF